MEPVLVILMLVATVSGIVWGLPIMLVLLAAPLGVAGIGYALGVFDPLLLRAIPSRIFGLLENRLLVSIPLFLAMGKLLAHSKLAEDLLLLLARPFANSGRTIAIATLVIAVLLAAASAVVGATVALLASVALHAMLAVGIDRRFASGLSVAGGTLGQLIPPSIVLILLADQISAAHLASEQEKGNFAPDPVSVGHIFAGALLPGLVLAAFYALYAIVRTGGNAARRDASLPGGTIPAGELGIGMGLLLICTFIGVPTGILLGWTSTLEAASLGMAGVLICIVATGRLYAVAEGLREAVSLTGVIFAIVIGASILSLIFRGLRGDEMVEALLVGEGDNETMALLLVLTVVFLLGFIMEFVEITYIVVPVTAPVLFALGVDPVWFAILMAVALQMSFLTPPMGLALFYFRAVSDIPLLELVKGVLPFLLMQAAVLGLVWLFPALATRLPDILL